MSSMFSSQQRYCTASGDFDIVDRRDRMWRPFSCRRSCEHTMLAQRIAIDTPSFLSRPDSVRIMPWSLVKAALVSQLLTHQNHTSSCRVCW